MIRKKMLYFLVTTAILSGCGNTAKEESTEKHYDDTKKMVTDILKSEDGKDALMEIIKEDQLKEALVMDQSAISSTIEKTLLSDKGKEFWIDSFKDPKFAASFSKSMQKEQESLMKLLMNDPEYQASMLSLLENDEMKTQILDVIKSQKYRDYLQTVILETMKSPLFQEKVADIINQSTKELLTQKEEKK